MNRSLKRNRVQPWFIATEKFGPANGEAWTKYVEWSGLGQLDEVVSLDTMLCPTMLRDIKDDYWPHIVNESFLLNFFVDLDFLLAQVSSMSDFNLLQVFRNPSAETGPHGGQITFEVLGYDLVELNTSTSALTNCGGFPNAFSNEELSSKGLLPSYERAREVQERLRSCYPEEHHADCDVWAIGRAIAL